MCDLCGVCRCGSVWVSGSVDNLQLLDDHLEFDEDVAALRQRLFDESFRNDFHDERNALVVCTKNINVVPATNKPPSRDVNMKARDHVVIFTHLRFNQLA